MPTATSPDRANSNNANAAADRADVIGLPAPALTHALLAPAGADLAVATGWSPQVSAVHADGTVHADPAVTVDLPADHPFWARAAATPAGVAAALLTVAGEPPALHLTCCHPGYPPVTVLVDASSCAAASLLSATTVTGYLLLTPTAGAVATALAVLPDPLLASHAAATHYSECDHCEL